MHVTTCEFSSRCTQTILHTGKVLFVVSTQNDGWTGLENSLDIESHLAVFRDASCLGARTYDKIKLFEQAFGTDA
jgi:hypothetical protein